jgi:hypothetical protein
MAGFNTFNTLNLMRTNIWSRTIKELLLDDLVAMKWVRILDDFPDGTTINIPSIGEAMQNNFVEGQAIKYNSMSTGNFTFSFDQMVYSANAISEKFKRDSFYSADVIAAFVPRQHRVIMEGVETNILSKINTGQTASNPNTINSAAHRWVAQGSNQSLSLIDLAASRYSLKKANVPLRDLVAIVDPSVIYSLQTQTNLINLITPDRKWQEITSDGSETGFKFEMNVFGFDFYSSNYLPAISSETITPSGGTAATVTTGVANYFFSSAPGDTLPIVGAFRQMPTVYSEFNKDLQQEEYLTVTEYGFKLYRPENMNTILTATGVVSF